MNLFSTPEEKGEKGEILAEAETLLATGRQPVHHFCPHCGCAGAQRNRRDGAGFFASIACLFLVAVVSLVLVTTRLFTNRVVVDPSLQLYSPVNHLVDYIPVQFNRSRGEDKTPFQGWPNDEIDRTWSESYQAGMLTTIDGSMAELLPEGTERLPTVGREDEYAVTLDVFHQMHCLDIVRMSLYRDRYDKHFYKPDGSVDYCKWLHVDHCLDQVRQALLCNADVSVVYFQWSDVVEGLRPRVDNKHTCRDYSKILDWAKSRSVDAMDWHPSRRVLTGPDGKFTIQQGRNHAVNSTGGECNAI
ncbi:hypothetical protein F5Y14DRAFT_395250 [Nemania sp. NC0429]|nr:hypothetical protein F5Y14DRAFT_395250 [Nemania sp. NC0429]